MTFMSSLAANPSGGSGIYGQPNQQSDQDVLGIVNQLKDREMNDFKNKAVFMSDLSLKQDKLRALFDPSKEGGPQQQQQQGPNVVLGKDPNEMSGYEKGELGIRQQGLGLERQKIAQQGKLGQEGLDIKSAQERLNQQKSDQINKNKQDDMQRKIDESNAKIEQAQKALESKNNNAEQALEAHKAMAAAVEERHKLELAQKDAQFKKVQEQHQQTIDQLEVKIKQAGHSKQVKKDSQGNVITTETTKGDAAETVNVKGPDGKTYPIPKDKLDDWNKNHQQQDDQQDENQ
jgi:hypothetical protein